MTTLNPPRLTFAQFQSTSRAYADLREVITDYFDADGAPVPGFAYVVDAGYQIFIEGADTADCSVEIGNHGVKGDLATCERELYAFYVSECADDDVRAYLMDAAPASEYRDGRAGKAADTEKSLCDLYKAWIHWEGLQGLNLGSADEHYYDERLTTEQQDWLKAYGDRWEEMLEAQDSAETIDRIEAESTPSRDDAPAYEPELPDNVIAENAHQACDDARRDLTTLWNHEIGRGNRTGALLVEELVMQAGVLAERARKYAEAAAHA